jgi:preprotein translocase subunit YajC
VQFLIPMMLLLVVMYVLMIRPQRKRQQGHQSMIDALAAGEDVLTTGGIYGTVTHAEGDDLVVEIADGISVHMTRRGIAAVLPPEEEEDEEEEDEYDDDGEEALDSDSDSEASDAELDEAVVTAGEESVTGKYDKDSWSGDRR